MLPPPPQRAIENTPDHFGKGALYRLAMPQLIQENSVLYLDCDVVCTMDIADIFTTNMQALPVVGASNAGDTRRHQRHLRSMGLDSTRYINTGVMLCNLDKLRNEYPDYADAVFASLAERRFAWAEQDPVNIYFQSKGLNIAVLPEAYNYFIGRSDRAYLESSEYAGKILHYHSRVKPWNVLFPAALQYWKYYAIAFSYQEAFEGMEKLKKPEHDAIYSFLLRSPRIHRMVRRAWNIEEQGIWGTILDSLFSSRRKQKSKK